MTTSQKMQIDGHQIQSLEALIEDGESLH